MSHPPGGPTADPTGMLNSIMSLTDCSKTFIVALCLSSAYASAQTPMPSRTNPAAPKPAAAMPVIPDIETIIQRLIAKGIGNGKREFETTKEYDKRRSAILDGIGSKQTLRLGKSATYDADTGQVQFDLSPDVATHMVYTLDDRTGWDISSSGSYSALEERLIIGLKSTKVSQSSYVGQNAFGVKTMITKIDYVEYGLVVSADSPVKVTEDMTLGFPMDRKEAKECMMWLKPFFEGEIVSAAIYRGKRRPKPTITAPVDKSTTYSYIPFRVDRVRVLDTRTGKLVHIFE